MIGEIILCQRHVTLKMGLATSKYKTSCDQYKYFKVETTKPCQDLEITVTQHAGEPNLYISKEPEEYPTLSKMVWSSYDQGLNEKLR